MAARDSVLVFIVPAFRPQRGIGVLGGVGRSADLSLSAQAKLLRAIQDLAIERVGSQGAHRVDIRIVAATNRALAGLVERGLFRPDLFYRLSGVDVRVPTLRERRRLLHIPIAIQSQSSTPQEPRAKPRASSSTLEI